MRFLILVIVIFLQLPAQAVTCNRLAKRYTIGLNANTGSYNLSLKIFSKITNTEYNAEFLNNIGDVWNITVTKNCNRFYAILPIAVIDNVGLDGDIGDYYRFDYECNGAIRKNGAIAGGCDFLPATYAGILITDSGGFNAYPVGNKRFRQIKTKALKLSDLINKNIEK